MRKVSNRLFLLFVIMSFAFSMLGLASCTSEESKNELKLSFEQKEYEVEVGEQIEISPIVTNAGEEDVRFVWKSYNASVVLVNDGVLEGVSVGKTEVKVYVSGKQNISATVTVKVTAKNNKPVATFNEVPEVLYVGDKLQLICELTNSESECEVVYQSLSDAAIVDQTGLIEVLEEGFGLISVKVTDKVTGQYVSYNFSFKVLTNYDITYKNVENAENENPSFYITEQKDVVLKDPFKLGYKFTGWFEDEKLTKSISVIDVDRKENITIYAGWEEILYTIDYEVNGGSLPINVKFEYQYSVGYELPLPIKLPTDKGALEGYKFAGWYENDKFEGEPVTSISTTDEGNKKYYAKWVDTILLEVEEPTVGISYKLGMYQKGLEKWLWMTGELSGYYGTAVEQYYNAADVEVVAVEGGYNLKVTKVDGSVVYINAVASGTYNNISFAAAATSVWTFNGNYNTFTTTTTNGVVYMGTYTNGENEFDTFGLSYESYAGNTTSYVAHLYQEVEDTIELRAELALDKLTLNNKMVEDYELPVVENVVWELLDGKGVAEIENGKLIVTRPEIGEDDVEIVVTAKYEVEGNIVKTKEFKVLVPSKDPVINAVAIFTFGTNGSASHYDGNTSAIATYSESNNGYTLSLSSGVKMYQDARDAKGNSCLKLGTSSAIGSFNLTTPNDVVKVVIYVAQYKSSATTISVNGTQYVISTASDAGNYTAIEIDTTVTKSISFATVSSKYRCMIDKVVYYGYSSDSTLTDQLIAEEILAKVSVAKTSLTEDYTLPTYENITWKLDKTYAAAKIENGVLKVTRPQYESGNTSVNLIAVCSINDTVVEKTFNITVVALLTDITIEKVNLTEEYELPVYENVSWKLQETYTAAKIENGILKVTRPEAGEDDVVIKLIAVYNDSQITTQRVFELIVLANDGGGTESKLLAEFTLGANGSASHNDGSSATTYSQTVNGYALSITSGTKMYTGARDAKGNSCLKLGTSSVVGSFKFTAPAGVNKVKIYVAKYKANTTKISVNGASYTLTNNSNNGQYDIIEVDVSSNKTVTFTTVSGGVRCMINTIEFYS